MQYWAPAENNITTRQKHLLEIKYLSLHKYFYDVYMKNIIIRIRERKNNLLLNFTINYDYNVNRDDSVNAKHLMMKRRKKCEKD